MSSANQALISVIIPVYNYAHLLEETVKSVQEQTYANWECILVDDGSTDNTQEIVKQMMEKDARILYFLQENSGPTIARNFGLTKAKGDFIQFLDADDLIENKKFEKQLALFEKNPQLDLVYGNVKYFKSGDIDKQYDDITLEGSKPWMKKLTGSGEEMIKALLNGNLMVIHSPLFKKSLIQKFGGMDEELYYNEDWDLWLRFAIGNANFLFDESTNTNALVRVHKSYSNDNFKMFLHGLKVCLKIDKFLPERKYQKILQPKIAYHKKMLDEKLVEELKLSKESALIKASIIYEITGIERYRRYAMIFISLPTWMCYVYMKSLAISYKLKNIILYA